MPSKPKSWKEKMAAKPPHTVTLEKAFAGVPAGAKLLISCPVEVAEHLKTKVPPGETQEIQQVRRGLAAAHGAGIVCTHAGGLKPRTRPHRVEYDDVVGHVIQSVTDLAQLAVDAGVDRSSIIIDPGHDFGKNSHHSMLVTRRLDELVETGWPVLVALSRKDFIGEALDLPPDDRLEGTLAATAVSAWLGARVFRAHDVEATTRVLRAVAAIRGTANLAAVKRGLA